MKKWLIGLFIVILLGAGAYAFQEQLKGIAFDLFLKNKVESTLKNSFEEVDPPDQSEPVKSENDPFTVLLLGIDARPGFTKGRSDAVIVATVRPKDNTISLVSIPRDSYVAMKGKGHDKLTHAYAYGGAQLSIETVENFLDVPIDYYASINFQGFEELIDQMGGIELPITKDISNVGSDHEKFTIEANKGLYSGIEALQYARYREDSDVKRGGRHQIIIQSMIDRMKSIQNIPKISSYFSTLGKNFKTNMPSNFATSQAKSFIMSTPTVSTYSMKISEDAKIDGIYYAKIATSEVQKVHDLIMQQLKP